MLMVKRHIVSIFLTYSRRQTVRSSSHFRCLLAYTGTEIEGLDGFDFEAYFKQVFKPHLTDTAARFTICQGILILSLVKGLEKLFRGRWFGSV